MAEQQQSNCSSGRHGGGMAVESVLHMNAGDGQKSYAHNSSLQRNVMLKVRPILHEKVRKLYGKNFAKYFTAADLGCSSGPNSLVATSSIRDAIAELCKETGRLMPEILVYLNDLPGNDFNNVFLSLSEFKSIRSKCFVSAMPGSFYGRLFPSRSLQFVHSSYSLHWLSQVPEGLEENKRNVFIGSTSPPSVWKAYAKQFQQDFTNFLTVRAEEVISSGRMVLTLIGRSTIGPTFKDSGRLVELLSVPLLEMADEGLVKAAHIDSFHFPHYNPCKEEVREVIEREGSFTIDMLETFYVNWDPLDTEDNKNYEFDKTKCGQNVALSVRAVFEPLLTSHFGDGLSMDDLFARYARNLGEHLAVEKTKYCNLVISLERR